MHSERQAHRMLACHVQAQSKNLELKSKHQCLILKWQHHIGNHTWAAPNHEGMPAGGQMTALCLAHIAMPPCPCSGDLATLLLVSVHLLGRFEGGLGARLLSQDFCPCLCRSPPLAAAGSFRGWRIPSFLQTLAVGRQPFSSALHPQWCFWM